MGGHTVSFARALATCWVVRSLTATLFALPYAQSLQVAVQHHPRGDAVLFEAGGAWLLFSLRKASASWPTVARWQLLLWLVASMGWLMAIGALVATSGRGQTQPAKAVLWGRVSRCFGSLVLLFGVTLLGQSLAFALALGLTHYGLAPVVPVGVAAAVRIAGWLVGLGLAWGLAVLQDMVRVQLICRQRDLYAACERVWGKVALCGLHVGWQAAWRTALALASYGAGLAFALHAQRSLWWGLLAGHAAALVSLYLRASFFRLKALH